MADRTDPILTYAFAKEHGVIVLETGETARIGVREGARPAALMEARRAIGAPVTPVSLSPDAFDRHLSEVYAANGFGAGELDDHLDQADDLHSLLESLPAADLLDSDDNAPIIRLINGLISEAIKTNASDIHIEPYEDRLSIRFRIDGILREVLNESRRLAPLLASRVKVMSRLDIAEKRVPQDGRMSLALGGRSIDVRVSTLPSRYGERVVLRLLDKERARLSLDDLGMEAHTLETWREALRHPNGVILVTGPTGSGKTTTLYASLTLLNDQTRNILTVEDPIEYGLDGIGQTQVNSKVGMTFASGLRAILRQDPDVVMVGEIRDVETARIAVQASLTGHLVLSTVHTNNAVAAITRLRDMGVEPFLLASTVRGILAQRLLRRLCDHCKEPYAPSVQEKSMLGMEPHADVTFHRAKGCPHCNNLGYEGRVGVYELAVIDDQVRRMIHDDAREMDITAHAFRNSDTLLRSGARHVLAGRTSSEEVLRVCRAESDGTDAYEEVTGAGAAQPARGVIHGGV